MIKKDFDNIIMKNSMLGELKLKKMGEHVKYIVKNSIPGDIVELGVWKGGCAAWIGQLLLEGKDPRVLHLFDSFEDPPEPLPIDGEKVVRKMGGVNHAHGRLIPSVGYYKNLGLGGPGNADEVLKLMTVDIGYKEENTKIYKGWIQETVPEASQKIGVVSLLILDCGLYEATKLCIEAFYDKVSPKGVIVVDDYEVYAGCKKAIDDFLYSRKLNPKLIRVNKKDCIYWVKD